MGRPEPGRELAEPAERRARLVGRGREPADRHEAPHLEVRERQQPGQRLGHARRREPGLARVGVDVHLEQDRQRPGRSDLGADPVEAPGELHGVDRLEAVEELHGAAGLVRLQGADEVPARPGNERHLGRGLLHAVLAEHVVARGDRGPQAVGGHGLADGDERHARGLAAGAGSRFRDPRQDRGTRSGKAGDLGRVRRRNGGYQVAGVHRPGYLLRRRKLGISRSSAS